MAVEDTARDSAATPEGETDAAERAARRGGLSALRWLWEWTKSLATALLIFLLIRTFLVEAFRIPTASMENTLLVGDFLLVNKAVYGAQIPGTSAHLPAFDQPRRGDVIVFVPPHDPARHYVKRVVGLPGDTIMMRDKALYLNGDAVAEPYVQHTDFIGDPALPEMRWQLRFLAGPSPRRYRPTRDNWGPIIVPPARLFVLGDNRDDSEDSRYWGFVEPAAVRGRPLLVYYSFEPDGIGRLPWLTEIRWSRIGGLIE